MVVVILMDGNRFSIPGEHADPVFQCRGKTDLLEIQISIFPRDIVVDTQSVLRLRILPLHRRCVKQKEKQKIKTPHLVHFPPSPTGKTLNARSSRMSGALIWSFPPAE